jgi:F420H(2)-dependent quinone reductase
MSKVNVWIYQRSGGRLGAKWPLHGVAICLLTSQGRKSGKPRVAPLLYMEDGENIVVVASKGGLPHNPQWFYNIKAEPRVQLQIGRTIEDRIARVAEPEERAVLWEKLTKMYPDYADYQRWTERTIPVVILERLTT